jgi:hypothetical protein
LRLRVDVTGARRAGRTGIFGAITCQRQHHLTGGRDIAESRTGILDVADAYTDVHCSGIAANGRQDTPWGLQPVFLISAASGSQLR